MTLTSPAKPVAILVHSHPALTKGGAEIAAWTLYQALRAQGVPAVFIAAVPREALDRIPPAPEGEYLLPVDPASYNHHLQLGGHRIQAELVALLRKLDVGLVNAHHYLNIGVGSLRALRAAGFPVVLTLHEYLAICAHHGQMVTRPGRQLCTAASATRCAGCFPHEGHLGMAMRHELLLQTLEQMEAFVSPSRFLMERYVDWGLPKDRFHLIENGLQTVPATAPARRSGAGHVPTFAYFGQINPFKGVDVLLDAAALLEKDPACRNRFRVVLHGNVIGLPPALEARLAALGHDGTVRMAGPYDNTQVIQLMSGADYIVVPSHWWENSPVVIQEAFASGRPVICSDIGGMAEKVAHGRAGWHFPVGQAAGLAEVMRNCITGAAKLPANGLPRPPDAAQMAASYLEVFARLLQPEAAATAPPEPPAAAARKATGPGPRKRVKSPA